MQSARLEPPTPAPEFQLEGMDGQAVTLADFRGRPLWMVLSRYAACPFCSLRVDHLIRRHPQVQAAGVVLLVVFPSPLDRIERYVMRYGPPFGVAADPNETIYGAYGSESSWVGEIRSAMNIARAFRAVVHAPNNPLAIDGDIHRMPCEFLIDAQGRLGRAFYGQSLDDGISVDEVCEWAGEQ